MQMINSEVQVSPDFVKKDLNYNGAIVSIEGGMESSVKLAIQPDDNSCDPKYALGHMVSIYNLLTVRTHFIKAIRNLTAGKDIRQTIVKEIPANRVDIMGLYFRSLAIYFWL
ncbi:hypothetical protein HAX54_018185 [Datura stramonium]|uniref:Uncharacterized protein n=1 Tax=Datura stramonium TaxID=4076 RepID=A0ABS8UM24_DATST|nr:hypothetical protein [Datura stramonium]